VVVVLMGLKVVWMICKNIINYYLFILIKKWQNQESILVKVLKKYQKKEAEKDLPLKECLKQSMLVKPLLHQEILDQEKVLTTE
jgi:hypothetical protein